MLVKNIISLKTHDHEKFFVYLSIDQIYIINLTLNIFFVYY